MRESSGGWLLRCRILGGFALFLCAVAVAGLSGCSHRDGASRPQVKGVGRGQSLSRAAYKSEGGYATKPAYRFPNTTRIKEAYPPGQRTETTVKVILNGRASDADWGIESVTGFHYMSRWVIDRHVKLNNGSELVEDLTYKQCRTLALYSKLRSLRFSLGGRAKGAMSILDHFLPNVGVLSLLTKVQAAPILNMVPGLRGYANQYANSKTEKVFGFINRLEGDEVEITYVNGQGVTSVRPINCTLTPREVEFVMDSSLVGDVYAMPKLHCQPGSTWHVNGSDLLPILDPSLHATPTGTIKIMRGVDAGTPHHPIAVLQIYSGVLTLRAAGSKWKSDGEWAPRGKLYYSFSKKLITKGILTGNFRLDRRSSHYILFEARQAVTPQYLVKFTCRVLP